MALEEMTNQDDQAQMQAEVQKVEDELEQLKALVSTYQTLGPKEFLARAKELLQRQDAAAPSQNTKDAIQNVNYALAALAREVLNAGT